MGWSFTPSGPGMASSWGAGVTGAENFAVGTAQSCSKIAAGTVALNCWLLSGSQGTCVSLKRPLSSSGRRSKLVAIYQFRLLCDQFGNSLDHLWVKHT